MSATSNITINTPMATAIKLMVTVWITATTVPDLINPVNAEDHHQDNAVCHPEVHPEAHPVALPEDQAETVAMEIS